MTFVWHSPWHFIYCIKSSWLLTVDHIQKGKQLQKIRKIAQSHRRSQTTTSLISTISKPKEGGGEIKKHSILRL